MIYVITNINGIIMIDNTLYSKRFPIEVLKKMSSHCEVCIFQDSNKEALDYLDAIMDCSDNQGTVDSITRVIHNKALFTIQVPNDK